MVKRTLLSGLFFFFCAACFAQNEYKVAAVGFYNCENFYDTLDDPNKKDEDFTPNGLYHYTDAVYKQKLHNIATVIEKAGSDITPDGPAIMGLAEIENDNVLNDLVEQPELKNRHYKYAWFSTPDERGMGVAMLYNPKYLTVLNAEPVHVPTESFPAKRKTRDILHVYGILAGDTVHIFVNHWPSKFGGEVSSERGRELAATISRRITDSLLNLDPNTKILLLGDFNDNPDGEAIEILGARAYKKDVRLTDIYNPWINMYKGGTGTSNYHDEWNLTDQIMLSGAFLADDNYKWKFHKAEIYNKDFLLYQAGRYKGLPHRSFTLAHVWDNGFSGHLPVIVYLLEKK